MATIPSYIAPTVATGVLGFGVLYWVGFAKVLPALGYEIDSEPDELVDGSRVVTYKVRSRKIAIQISIVSLLTNFIAVQNWLCEEGLQLVGCQI